MKTISVQRLMPAPFGNTQGLVEAATYPVSERGRKSRSGDLPVRSIVRAPTCTQFAARLCERSLLRTGKSALRPPSLTGYALNKAPSPLHCMDEDTARDSGDDAAQRHPLPAGPPAALCF